MFKLLDGTAPKSPDDLSGPEHRRLLGIIGFFLPLILIVMAVWRDGWENWLNLDSVSAYYYSGAVSAFAGMLIAFAFVLFTYRGYRDESGEPAKADRRLAIAGGFAALGVALFPTSAPTGFEPLPWVEDWVVKVHFGSAAALFIVFAAFCLWLFRKKAKGDAERERTGKKAEDPEKEGRNAIYLFCGLVIVGCIAWAAVERLSNRSIFWPESVALMFFAISWLVKGFPDARGVKGASKSTYWLLSLLLPKAADLEDREPSNR